MGLPRRRVRSIGRFLLLCMLPNSIAFVTPGPQHRAAAALLSPLASKQDDEDAIVTKEMLLRDMLAADKKQEEEEVIVRKKAKKGSKKQRRDYKVMDNRDILPFQVRSQTPDPYTHPQTKRERAVTTRKNKKAVEEQLMMVQSTLYSTSNSGGNKKTNKRNGKKTDDVNEDVKTLLGEYQLHKDTTTGDTLLIGSAEYKVVRHRCQYKYAGGKRFVMVRKILEVKEVGRLLSEQYLKQQWSKSSDADEDAVGAGLLD